LHSKLECQVHESRQIGSGQTGDGKSDMGFIGIVFQAEGAMYDEAVIYLVLLGKGIS